jgi:hypothetical protein
MAAGEKTAYNYIFVATYAVMTITAYSIAQARQTLADYVKNVNEFQYQEKERAYRG